MPFYEIQYDIDICLPIFISSIFDICFYFYIITWTSKKYISKIANRLIIFHMLWPPFLSIPIVQFVIVPFDARNYEN